MNNFKSEDFGNNERFVSSCMMDESPRYGSWMTHVMKSHLTGNLLEVGCGPGNYSADYANLSSVSLLTAADLDENMIEYAKKENAHPKIKYITKDVCKSDPESFDSIVCANVMEHVEDHVAFAKSLHSTLKQGGSLALLVPAHQLLYSKYDHEAGHYRRYNRRTAQAVLNEAGFIIDKCFYFNFIGALGWYYAFKIKQTKAVEENTSRGMVRIFENYCLPVGRFLESFVRPPFGLSVVVLCTKK